MTSVASDFSGRDPADVLLRLLADAHTSPSIFSPSFLRQITVQQVALIIADLNEKVGNVHEIIPRGRQQYQVVCQGGMVEACLELDNGGKISALSFGGLNRNEPSLQHALNRLRARPGDVSYAVVIDDCLAASHDAHQRLLVGSSSKLAILNAVADAYRNRQLDPIQIVLLDERFRSLPSGLLQNWPVNCPLTIDTLVNLMISQSDNTAADTLLSLVGATGIAPYAGSNIPFPSTRQAWIVRGTSGESLRQLWREADAPLRVLIQNDINTKALPAIGDIDNDIEHLGRDRGIEWHYTTVELCGLIARVANMDVFSIYSGIPRPAGIERLAYKGGSDVGIANSTFNISTGLKTAQISATWNLDHLENFTPTSFFENVGAVVRATAVELLR